MPSDYAEILLVSLFFGHVIDVVAILALLLAQDRIVRHFGRRFSGLNANMKGCEARHYHLIPRHADDTIR